MSSAAQIRANQANAQHSTGAKTPEGKRISSNNALKSGLTGQTILLPTDDVAAYQRFVNYLVEKYRPVGCEEESLVQSLADTDWRLHRIPSLEAGIMAIGTAEFADDESIAADLIPSHVFLKYERPLRNLCIQEARLDRRYQKDLERLKTLQIERAQAEQRQKAAAAPTAPAPKSAQPSPANVPPAAPSPAPAAPEIGFEFTNAPQKGKQAA